MAHTALTAIWSGSAGLPGYSKFRFNTDLDNIGATAARDRLKGFFQQIAPLLPTAVQINFDPIAIAYDAQGQALGERNTGSTGAVGGQGAGPFAAPAGACVNWATGVFVNGKKVRGRTFLVPLTAAAYEADGTLLNSARTGLDDAAGILRGGPVPLVILSGVASGVSSAHVVTGHSIADKVAILRSRRG